MRDRAAIIHRGFRELLLPRTFLGKGLIRDPTAVNRWDEK